MKSLVLQNQATGETFVWSKIGATQDVSDTFGHSCLASCGDMLQIKTAPVKRQKVVTAEAKPDDPQKTYEVKSETPSSSTRGD